MRATEKFRLSAERDDAGRIKCDVRRAFKPTDVTSERNIFANCRDLSGLSASVAPFHSISSLIRSDGDKNVA